MHTEEVIAKLRQKQKAAKCFFWMQAWFVFVGLVDLILGMTVAHSSGYGHDYSMYAFVINGAIMLCLAALGLIGATKKKSLLPFHFYMTLILANMTLFISIYTLAREEAVNNYIRQNFEHMALDKDEPKTAEEMIEDIDALMTIVGVMGFVTVLTYVGSEAILLWLLGTTRTISSILVTIDGTFICGGLSVFFLASSANSETTAFGPLLSVSIWLAIPFMCCASLQTTRPWSAVMGLASSGSGTPKPSSPRRSRWAISLWWGSTSWMPAASCWAPKMERSRSAVSATAAPSRAGPTIGRSAIS